MKIVKMIINSIMAFFLSLLIIVNFSVMVLSNTILQKDYILGKVEEIGYYEKVDTDLKNGFEDYQYQSGLPEGVFENLYSENTLKSDINSVINCIYDGTEVQVSTAEVQERLDANIQQYITENNLTLNEEQQKNVESFKNIIVGVYANKINLIGSYGEQISNLLNKIKSVEEIVSIVLIVALIVFILFGMILNFREMNRFANSLCISFMVSGVIFCLIKFVIHQNIDINHLVLLNQSFSDFVRYIMSDLLDKFGFYGIVFIVVGIAGIVWSNWRKKFD